MPSIQVPVPPLSVSISGPSTVWHTQVKGQPANYYSWTTNVSGGQSPYTFTWYKNGSWVGNGATYGEYFSWNGSGGGSYQFTLRVDVRDALNTLASASLNVSAYNSGGIDPSVEHIAPEPLLTDFSISQNFPNPFNPETEITFGLPEPSKVTVTVTDLLGRELVTLANGQYTAGYQRVRWNGTNAAGNKVGSGIYFYKITATGESGRQFTKVMKMLLVQ